jgi:hypothetical protein
LNAGRQQATITIEQNTPNAEAAFGVFLFFYGSSQ